ncbi:hypothetical protein QQP08_012560 [Theobroma cacao]|nr:hypothetical protein QQP08_012560 [Theobroma cacao]
MSPTFNNQCPWNRTNINPLILVQDLEATHLVMQEHSEEGTISVLAKAQSQFWFRARWMAMTYKMKSCAAHVFQMAGLETRGFRYQLKNACNQNDVSRWKHTYILQATRQDWVPEEPRHNIMNLSN